MTNPRRPTRGNTRARAPMVRHCGLCNTPDPAISEPGGLCRACLGQLPLFDRADADPKVTRLGGGVGKTIRYGDHDRSRAIVWHHVDQANRPVFVYRDEDHRSLYLRTLIVKDREGRCG